MLGCYATADASQTIRLDLDNELAGMILLFSPAVFKRLLFQRRDSIQRTKCERFSLIVTVPFFVGMSIRD